MDVFNGLFVMLDCPECGYGMDVELLSIRLEAMVFCPCCKVTIRLEDADASVDGAQHEIESQLNDLKSQLEKLNATIQFTI